MRGSLGGHLSRVCKPFPFAQALANAGANGQVRVSSVKDITPARPTSAPTVGVIVRDSSGEASNSTFPSFAELDAKALAWLKQHAAFLSFVYEPLGGAGSFAAAGGALLLLFCCCCCYCCCCRKKKETTTNPAFEPGYDNGRGRNPAYDDDDRMPMVMIAKSQAHMQFEYE